VKPALALIALFLALIAAAPVSADDSARAAYRQVISNTLDIVQAAQPTDIAPAQHALDVLTSGVGHSQPEVEAALKVRPPDYSRAATELRAVIYVLDHPAATSDPALAQQRLHEVMSMQRYDALRRPPSFFDRLSQWIQDRIEDLIRALGSGIGPGGVVPTWVVYAIGVAVLAVVFIVVLRSSRGRLSGGFAAGGLSGPQAPADYFAEADRLVAKGDRVGAIRALCAGVAGTLAGERTWEGSPLTVREIFRRAPEPRSLDPLLRPFEAAVYGDRDVDEETYKRAAEVAARFRTPVERAA